MYFCIRISSKWIQFITPNTSMMKHRLKDTFGDIWRLPPSAENGIACIEVNADMAYNFNKAQGKLFCFAFSIVTSGWATLLYNGHELTISKGDFYNYIPGFEVAVVSTSADYHAICLLAEEDKTYETPIVRNVIRAAYLPYVELKEPKLTLTQADAQKLCQHMQNIIDYQQSDHLFRNDVLHLVYSTFLLDLLNILEHSNSHHRLSERAEEHFMKFIHLLPQHFMEHRDISFYADRLCITPIYLSRIVKQMTGRTVLDHINHLLLMEASWLLQTTRLSVFQIAERLHFSNHASFIRFFTRMKGITPKRYRRAK